MLTTGHIVLYMCNVVWSHFISLAINGGVGVANGMITKASCIILTAIKFKFGSRKLPAVISLLHLQLAQ